MVECKEVPWVALLAAAVLLVPACGRGDAPQGAGGGGARASAVAVARAVSQDVELAARAVGTVQAVESIDLTTEVQGLVESADFEQGQRVAVGDVIVRLDSARAQAELGAAVARRDRLRREAETIEQLYREQAATNKELLDIRVELTELDAQVRVAELKLEDHEIRAPFTGQIGLRLKDRGAYVQPGDALTTLQSVDPIEVEFAVPEREIAQLRPGLRLTLRTAAYPERVFPGAVAAIDPRVNMQTRSVTVVGRLPNADGLLKPGMFGEVELVVQVREDATVVPETAVFIEGSRGSAFVVSDGKLQRRRITLGQRGAGLVEIREGIEPGDLVVTSDPSRLRDGAAVNPRPDDTLADLGIDPAPFVQGLGEALAGAAPQPSAAPADAVTR